MPYLKDIIYLNSNTECPEPFLIWSGLSLLGATLGRRVFFMHGRFRIHPTLYVVMVGSAGAGKSSARMFVKRLYVECFPKLLVSASIQSREDIADLMASDDCIQTWKDEAGICGPKNKIYEHRPFYIISNELQSFLSVDRGKMLEFLVDIFDDDDFSTGFKGQRKQDPESKQRFTNPAVSLLGCATPRWFMQNLKFDLFEGGLGRRLIIVNSEKQVLVDTPGLPPNGEAFLAQIKDHLMQVSKIYGEVKRTPEAIAWWKNWYNDESRFSAQDPILAQFHQTKHIQLIKVATLLSLCDLPLKLEIDVHHFAGALVMLNNLEKDIGRLTSGIGRNVLAGIGAAILAFLEKAGGASTELHLKKFFWRELQTKECAELLQHYITTKEIVVASEPTTGTTMYFLPEAFEAFQQGKLDRFGFSSQKPERRSSPPSAPQKESSASAQEVTPETPPSSSTSIPPSDTPASSALT